MCGGGAQPQPQCGDEFRVWVVRVMVMPLCTAAVGVCKVEIG